MSTVIDTLIFDRTQADVERVATQKNKILLNGWGSLSVEEQNEWLAGMRGAYNYTDLNRVGSAVAFLAARFTDIPRELAAYRKEKGVADNPIYDVPYNPKKVSVSPRTDWTVADTPTDIDARLYLQNLSNLRTLITLPADAPAVPSSLSGMTYEAANDIERLLSVIYATLTAIEQNIYRLIDNTSVSFMYAGEIYAGE